MAGCWDSCVWRSEGVRAVNLRSAGICPVVVVLLWSGCGTAQPAPDAAREIASSFLDSIRAGQAVRAWESTTAEFKSARGKEAFLRDLRSNPSLKGEHAFVSQQLVSVQNTERPELLFRSSAGKELRIVLGEEGGAWKVDRWTYAP